MMNPQRILLSSLLLSFLLSVLAADSIIAADRSGLDNYYKYEERIEWFKDVKFGIFIHWGLYSQVGYTEWCQNHFEMQAEEYSNLMSTFNPVDYKPDEWAELFKNSGAKYVVMTSKHHEGFSMYDTEFSNYNIMNSPYSKDVLGILNGECTKRGLKFGIYYSIMDWHHEDYLPRRYFDERSAASADSGEYKAFFKNQVGELLDKYNPAIMWFDGEWENTHDSLETVELVDMMFRKNPSLIFNNRLSRHGYGDFKTPENEVPPTGLFKDDGTPEVWETCSTMGEGWGYDPFANYFYSSRDLIRMLIDVCSKGGNLLLNVGPTPQGEIRSEHRKRMEDIGKWLDKNGESIFGSRPSVFERLPFYGKSTTKGNIVFLHVFMPPKDNILRIPLLENEIISASLLEGNTELDYVIKNNQIQVQLPNISIDENAFVVKLELDGKPSVITYTPRFGKKETMIFDGTAAEIISPQRHTIENIQYYDKILIKNWNEDNSDVQLKWDFEIEYDGRYEIMVHCASEKKLRGEIDAIVAIDTSKIKFIIIEKPRWTATNKLLYEPYNIGEIFMKSGKHSLYIQADTLRKKQSIVFKDVQLIPARH
ncbi:hypothetical protein CEE37_13160 [candidate division LCP-89 bacterium B3_LCP]|uniref:alpha-L-fucosidase n=1 Tax=candidate division LCP-89 bacterium B3_LCP TaxID=2012998 RepID=A0A532USW6_UNCL8|nr:MAG: hypothetical protein CEE37_13160 [candidate division LCP-89 bacterium B3_LCP]